MAGAQRRTDLTFPLIDTGERGQREAFSGFNVMLPRFRAYRVGLIDFPKPGAQQITLNPTGLAGKGIRISSVTLTPLDETPGN